MPRSSIRPPAAAPQALAVAADEAGRRLDNFLLSRLPVPRRAVYRWIRTGQVRLNGGRAKPAARLAPGDRVRVPPHRAETPPAAPEDLPEIAIPVLHEDAHLLAVNKPPGLPAHGGSRAPFGLIELLRAARGADEYLELAHRLDRGASGCLLLARGRAALADLHAQLRARTVEKVYWCLAAGRWRGGARAARMPLTVRRSGARGRKTVADAGGRAAATRFAPLERFAGACLLEARIETGRTHQIRAHARELGHPLVGDDRYGDRAANRAARARGFRGLFLHARALRLRHPATGAPLALEAPLGRDAAALLARLRAEAAGPYNEGGPPGLA